MEIAAAFSLQIWLVWCARITRLAGVKEMRREYCRWFSGSLGRDMEMLVFGHSGLPIFVFPTSGGRFYEFEENGMVHAVEGEIETGRLQLFCVDSVNLESWYNRDVPPRWRIARHMQYEEYLLTEVLPLIRQWNGPQRPIALGCSLGGYNAADIALRHPTIFQGFLSLSGIFDPSRFLQGYYDEDVYFHSPPHFLPSLNSVDELTKYQGNIYVLATGDHDQCWDANERMAEIFRTKRIAHRLDVWSHGTRHDWPWWRQMIQAYL